MISFALLFHSTAGDDEDERSQRSIDEEESNSLRRERDIRTQVMSMDVADLRENARSTKSNDPISSLCASSEQLKRMEKVTCLINNDEMWHSFQREMRSRRGCASTNLAAVDFVNRMPAAQCSVPRSSQRAKHNRSRSISSITVQELSDWLLKSPIEGKKKRNKEEYNAMK